MYASQLLDMFIGQSKIITLNLTVVFLFFHSLIGPTIEKGNQEVKLTSDVYNRPPYSLINRVVGCVHHDMFTYPTLYTCILSDRISWGW